MNKDIAGGISSYDEAVIPWACEWINAEMLQTLAQEYFHISIPKELLEDTILPMLCNTVRKDIKELIEANYNPSKCTTNPFVYQYEHNRDMIDVSAVMYMVDPRSRNIEEFRRLTDEAIKELKNIKMCDNL